ncbi:MAG: glutamine synthetase III [Corallococcus sp.]|nr:glutamine synthetase III [Corallococcus sp.]
MESYNVADIFGQNVFGDKTMRERLPQEVYQAVKRTMSDGCPMSDKVADVYADALKQWALEKGATHYAHWFQPMTGITAEKHDSFVSIDKQGEMLNKFRGKELIKGEPDASSFPSGGIRATFEARGYTTWDPTSYVFIKDGTMFIPTAFCSYSGETLDKKTPLLRSNQALNKQVSRILKLFGSDGVRACSTVGAEQEYFLIDKSVFLKRKDLVYTGRTLIGAKPPKGQEMDDHYFGAIKPRVAKFMREVDEELLKLGIVAKTEHNEVAPAQHELAPCYTQTNIACDQNQLTMEIMKKVADRNNMACLLHEKPFAGINGSGKHINWSIATDNGVNLLEPGVSPQDNAQFLLLMSAVIKAVDNYQDLLRVSVSSAGNDHRLGANEAPPAIISIFVGDDLEYVINAVISGEKAKSAQKRKLHVGVDSLPLIPADNTDRNRTSPFAFTGNKFEFRMPGSSFSIADPNTILNTAVAESLCEFADKLERAENFNDALNKLICQTLTKHRRIIFNGDGYSDAWVAEAEKRGLANIRTTPDSLKTLTAEKNIALFEKHGIFTKREIESRQEILLENYCKTIEIEALTLVEMENREILPSAEKYVRLLAETAKSKREISETLDNSYEQNKIRQITELIVSASEKTAHLQNAIESAQNAVGITLQADLCKNEILPLMEEIRAFTDKLETVCPKELWPMPTYGELLYSVN